MYEDAKLYKNNIYTAYSYFKGLFGGMDHLILFHITRDYEFQDSYIAACEQLYAASNTYYMTIHGNTIPIPIYLPTIWEDYCAAAIKSWTHIRNDQGALGTTSRASLTQAATK